MPIAERCSSTGKPIIATTAAAMIATSMPLMIKPGISSIGSPELAEELARIARLPRPDRRSTMRAQQNAERDRGQHADRDRIARQRPHHPEIDQRAEQRRAGQAGKTASVRLPPDDDERLEEQEGAEDHQVSVRQIEDAGRAIDQHVSHAEQGIEARLDQDHEQQDSWRACPRCGRGSVDAS